MVSSLDSSVQSFARVGYHEELEAAFNEQINVELNISYGMQLPSIDSNSCKNLSKEICMLLSVQANMDMSAAVYHALHSFFNRDNVGLPGLAKYFQHESDSEREHAQLLINFQVSCLLAHVHGDVRHWKACHALPAKDGRVRY